MSYVAAIDIGSNAVRLAIAKLTPEGFHITHRSREAVRLGSGVFSHGKIDDPTYENLKDALLKFKNQLSSHNVLNFRAIATSAMREATNSEDIVKKLHEKTGILIEVISGKEEARLVSLAISQKINIKDGNHLLIDIGGGSIELVAVVEGQIIKKQSYVLGMVRILELQKKKKDELALWFPDFIEEQTSDFFKKLPPLLSAVGTGGNMDRFIKLKRVVSDRDGTDLNRKEMLELYEKLAQVDYKERMQKFSLKADRADVIVPAAIATLKFMNLAKCENIFFPEVGLKDGVLYELSSSSEN